MTSSTAGTSSAASAGAAAADAAASDAAASGAAASAARGWPLWEVFVRPGRGLSHIHAGSLHAADEQMALGNARDLYTRRGEGVSIWVVRSTDIAASSPDEKDALFDPAADKVYRHPTFFTASAQVPGL